MTKDQGASSTDAFRSPKSSNAEGGDHENGKNMKKTPKAPSAAKSKSKPKVHVPDPGPPAPETEAAQQARLRRICERKPSGRMHVPEHIHQRWKNGTKADRAELLEQLEAADWDKDCHPAYKSNHCK